MKKNNLTVRMMLKMMEENNTILKCIIKLSNGLHKTVRVMIGKVAAINLAFRQLKEANLIQANYAEMFREMEINPYLIVSIQIIDESTKQEFLCLD